MHARVLTAIEARAARRPDGIALQCGQAVRTARDVLAAGRAAGQALLERGVQPGDTVGLWMEYRFEAVAALLGCWAIGAAALPLDGCARFAQAAAAQRRAGAWLLVTTPRRAIQVSERGAAVLTCDRLQARGAAPAAPAADPDAPAVFLHGGAVLTHAELAECVDVLSARLGLGPSDRFLTLQPLGAPGGLLPLLASLTAGAGTFLFNRTFSRDVPDLAAREGITVLAPEAGLLDQLAHLHWPPCPSLRQLVAPTEPLGAGTLAGLRCQLPATRLLGATWNGLPHLAEPHAA
ncbi:MAG: AMP-binding protein [Telluria sp.]